MDGLARPIGGEATIKWQGKLYRLAPLVARDFGTIENELLRRRREAKIATVASLYGKIPDEAFAVQFDRVRKECETLRISDREVQQWIDDDREGICFTLWLALDKTYPGEFVYDDMLPVIAEQLSPEEVNKLLAARDQASGFDAAGNETGPALE